MNYVKNADSLINNSKAMSKVESANYFSELFLLISYT